MRSSVENNDFVLAIDQGTTNTKALLVSRSGAVAYKTSSPVPLLHAHPDRIEQSPEEIWRSVVEAIARCVSYVHQVSGRVVAFTISNQRETAVAWRRKTGRPLGNAISWQCRRSGSICKRLSPHANLVRSKAGLPLDPLLTATKWAWMLENPERSGPLRSVAGEGELCLGTVDSWLIFKLTDGRAKLTDGSATEGWVHATDHSNASRTGLLDLENLRWDDELLALFEIPRSALPEIHPSAGFFGEVRSIAALSGVPIVAAVGDSHAALAAHSSKGSGTVKATYGTGSSLMTLCGSLPQAGAALARTVAWSSKDGALFALEGNIAMTGAAVQWVGEFLGSKQPIEDAIALAAEDSAGLFFVPAMAGLGAPYWDAEARGVVCGLARSHTAAHLAKAAVDAIAYQVADVFDAIEEAMHSKSLELHADGGGTRNRSLMQFQADILDRDVLCSRVEELSALGAAWLGGVALGWWKTLSEPAQAVPLPERVRPRMPRAKRDQLRSGWRDAVGRALTRRMT